MGKAATQTRHNRTITVDFQDETTYFRLLDDGKAFVEFVLAFFLSFGFQLTHGDLSRGRVSDPPLALRPCPPGWSHHLAHPVCEVQSGVHGPPALRLTLSLDAPRRRPQRPVGDAWGAEFGAVCGDWSYLAYGALPPRLCVWTLESGSRADPVRSAAASIFPG